MYVYKTVILLNKLKFSMNIKRILGSLLSVLGIGSLIYTAIVFANTKGYTNDIKALVIYGVLGLLFFFSGMGLLRTTKDEP
jgi:formate-dependent nitrite reductase membrane component NrfD